MPYFIEAILVTVHLELFQIHIYSVMLPAPQDRLEIPSDCSCCWKIGRVYYWLFSFSFFPSLVLRENCGISV